MPVRREEERPALGDGHIDILLAVPDVRGQTSAEGEHLKLACRLFSDG
jgi:hypothetical protein